MMIKIALIVMLCSLTLYPILELSRAIVVYDLRGGTIFELAFMWTFYLVGIVILTKVVKV